MKVSSAKLTGNPSEVGWTQVHEFVPSDHEKANLRGHLFAVISAPDAEHGREVITRINEEYFGNLEGLAYDALKNTVHKIWSESKGESSLKILAAAIVDNELYASVVGQGDISVFRDGKFTKIISGDRDIHSIKGPIQASDLLVLSTSEFFEGIGEGIIKAAFSTRDPGTVVETFGPMIHTSVNQSVKGAVVVRFDEGGIETKPEKFDELGSQETETSVSEKRFHLGRFNKPNFPRRKVFVKRAIDEITETRRRKTTASVGLLLLVLLVVSIIFGVRQKSIKSAQNDYNQKFSEAKHNIEEGKNLFTLNPQRARELFAHASDLIGELEKEGPSDLLADLKKLYDEGKQRVLGEFDTEAKEYLDLSLIEGLVAEKIAATADAVYVYDKAKKRVVEVVLDTKKTEVVVGPTDLGDIEEISAYLGKVYVAEGEGIFEVSDSRKKVIDKEWTGDILLYAYAGNIYILEKGTSVIWRFSATNDGLGSGKNWLAPGISVDLSSVASWAIDGSVWILNSKGKVEKYSFGSPRDYGQMVVIPELKNPTTVYTNEELDNLYILDPATERVVVFDKDGNYKAQYKSGVLKEAIGLAASEKEGKIIVLTKDKLYSISVSN